MASRPGARGAGRSACDGQRASGFIPEGYAASPQRCRTLRGEPGGSLTIEGNRDCGKCQVSSGENDLLFDVRRKRGTMRPELRIQWLRQRGAWVCTTSWKYSKLRRTAR